MSSRRVAIERTRSPHRAASLSHSTRTHFFSRSHPPPFHPPLSLSSHKNSIKRWKGDTCVQTYTGHTDVVRSLALVEGIGFLSASNDGTVRLWEMVSGNCLNVLHASESFLYSVAVLPGGEWLTCSEDRTLKVWQANGSGSGGECVQSITHPSSVWACAVLSNGDLAAGCADGNAYVWTRNPSRAASEGEQLQFKETVASVTMPTQQVESSLGALEKDIKGSDALLEAGTKEGQTLIVREEGSKVPMLYQWSMASSSWEKVLTMMWHTRTQPHIHAHSHCTMPLHSLSL